MKNRPSVVANVFDYNILVNDFELHPYFEKVSTQLYLNYGLSCIIKNYFFIRRLFSQTALKWTSLIIFLQTLKNFLELYPHPSVGVEQRTKHPLHPDTPNVYITSMLKSRPGWVEYNLLLLLLWKIFLKGLFLFVIVLFCVNLMIRLVSSSYRVNAFCIRPHC